MYRRKFIAATTAVAVAGCVGSGQSATPATEHGTPVGVKSEAAPPSSVVLEYGEWYEEASTRVTVTDASIERGLGTEGTASDDALPPETKLVLISGELENTTNSPLALSDDVSASFGVIASDRLYEPAPAQQSDGNGTSIDVSHVTAGSGTELSSAMTDLDPGERLTVWQAVLVPSSLTTESVQVTMYTGDSECGVRWEPSEKTCDCPG